MNRYDLVLFDFDGTLMNTEEGIKASISKTLGKYRLGEYTSEELDKYIGPPFNESLAMFFPYLPDDKIWEVTNDFREDYKENSLLMFNAVPLKSKDNVLHSVLGVYIILDKSDFVEDEENV